MFDTIRDRISQAFGGLRGKKVISESVLENTLRQVRRALLEADVALPVAKEFISLVKARASQADVLASLTPDQTILTIVHEELTNVIGRSNVPLDLKGPKPSIILIAGLQGSGKTTTAAKLAKLLATQDQKKVMLASVDVYRPAAIDQLRTHAELIGVDFFEPNLRKHPVVIAKSAVKKAVKNVSDVIILDTAGRLHVDSAMMNELKRIARAVKPTETLFVIDAMIGQDAVNSAAEFNSALDLTGVVVTKLDSDTRGGALLSVRHVTGKPVKFIGVGEHVDAIEHFHPDRIASRILGMGDILSIIESAQQKADQQKAKKLEQKLRKGRRMDLSDYRDQMMMTQDMGGIANIAKLLPGMPTNAMPHLNNAESEVRREIAIINSMTPHERRFPSIIRGSRRVRISAGAGVASRDVNQLLRKFDKLQRMTKKMTRKKGKMKNMPGMNQMPDMEELMSKLRMR